MRKWNEPCTPRVASGRDGAVLVIIMLVAAILLLATTAMMALAGNASFRIRRITSDAKALSIAEAGIADMIGKMTMDYWYWQNNYNREEFGDGTFEVTSRVQLGGNVLLVSTGTVGTVSRATSVELLGNERARNDSFFRVDGAILSGGDVRFRTSDFTILGNVHSNQDVTSESGADQGLFLPAEGFEECFITAAGQVGELDATLEGGVEPRELPEFNFDGYRQMAIEDGIYLEGDQNIRHFGQSVEDRPANGIAYVNGDITLGGESYMHGTLVVNGDVNLRNYFETIAFAPDADPPMPAILATGNIYLGNQGHIEGMIYAGINIYVQNHVTIDGGMISEGYTEINNRTEIEHATDPPPWDPTQPDVPPEIIIGGWLR